jgi:hypothetical protein
MKWNPLKMNYCIYKINHSGHKYGICSCSCLHPDICNTPYDTIETIRLGKTTRRELFLFKEEEETI